MLRHRDFYTSHICTSVRQFHVNTAPVRTARSPLITANTPCSFSETHWQRIRREKYRICIENSSMLLFKHVFFSLRTHIVHDVCDPHAARSPAKLRC